MPRLSPSEIDNRHFDFVIVGGGTAGCVLGARLSASGEYNVLVLEAGVSTQDDLLEAQVPLYNGKLKNTDADWKLESIEQTAARDRKIGVPLGKLLGGCSAFNACLLHRCSPSDYNAWETEGWAYDDLKEYFRRAENYHDDGMPVDDRIHGTQGPLNVTHINKDTVLGSCFRKACLNYGLQEYRDMTDMECQIGITDMEATIYQGKRSSTGTSYLPIDIQNNRSNLYIGMGSKVTRLIVDGNNVVTHVEYVDDRRNDKIYRVVVDREAIVSAGAILSPAILLKSGIGPKAELEELNIKVKVDLPGVGKNLQNHWRVPLVHETTQKDMSLHQDIFEREKESLDLLLQSKNSALSQLWPDVVAYMKIPNAPDNSSSVNNTPQIELFAGGLALCRKLPDLKNVDCATLLMVYVAPFSRGSVTLNKKNEPIVDMGLLQDDRDLECLEKGLIASMQIASHSDYERKCVKKWIMHPDLEGDIKEYIKANVDTLHHYAGTCKMGLETDPTAVVDSHLRVYGVKKLRVIDASFFPKVPAGQTCFPVIACAERASDIILLDNK